ncbi:reticulon-4-interacting protein 1 homolog, mitochondrial [Hydra vulgaris]|uniref:Reticulon-4-interacting protein 1 homolog, mitochondrial n=1 Tax=Hydra vulgaris TaxID=6087 RepID=A0ABM4C651_HYDVU
MILHSRKVFQTPIKVFCKFIHIPSQMKCIQLESYAPSLSGLNISKIASTKTNLKPNEILVKVHAASVNPIDIEMSKGYGSTAINFLRKTENIPEFPLILGRDCSGEIVAVGKQFHRLAVGSHVYCTRWVVGQGTHAEYVIVNKNEISLKPKNLSHIEAASLAYVSCTAWNALINSGAVSNNTFKRKKRIFIPGGSGGLGSFATQLCMAYGHDVVTSCSEQNINVLHKLGIKNVLNYESESYFKDLSASGPYDVILDTLKETFKEQFMTLLKKDQSSFYISLSPTILGDVDQLGLPFGLLKAAKNYFSTLACQINDGKGLYYWGFVNPSGLILDNVRLLVEEGKILPLVDRVFNIDDGIESYKYLMEKKSCGKVVIGFP